MFELFDWKLRLAVLASFKHWDLHYLMMVKTQRAWLEKAGISRQLWPKDGQKKTASSPHVNP